MAVCVSLSLSHLALPGLDPGDVVSNGSDLFALSVRRNVVRGLFAQWRWRCDGVATHFCLCLFSLVCVAGVCLCRGRDVLEHASVVCSLLCL
jgi:hypothetical protein